MIKKDLPVKKNLLLNKLKIYVPAAIVVLILLKINKALFFISIFTFLAYQLKMIRGRFGLKIVVLDTLHFSALMIGAFIGLKEAVFFVMINTLVIDFITFIASDGTFVNFFLYSASTVLAILIFGKTNMLFFGSVAALMYSVTYYAYRTFVVPNAPLEVISKCITSFIFTFLYITFFGPIMKILMSA
jgi:hypothetical protein